jgi:hypothetical protein
MNVPHSNAARVGALIAEYKAIAADASGSRLERKFSILEEELCALEDERILSFFLEVAGDKNDLDEARISVFKALKAGQWRPSPEQFAAVGEVLAGLMTDPADDALVRTYAAQAASAFVDAPGVFPTAARLLLDPSENAHVRHWAFATVQGRGPTKEARDVLACVVADPEVGEYARNLLREYEAAARPAP